MTGLSSAYKPTGAGARLTSRHEKVLRCIQALRYVVDAWRRRFPAVRWVAGRPRPHPCQAPRRHPASHGDVRAGRPPWLVQKGRSHAIGLPLPALRGHGLARGTLAPAAVRLPLDTQRQRRLPAGLRQHRHHREHPDALTIAGGDGTDRPQRPSGHSTWWAGRLYATTESPNLVP